MQLDGTIIAPTSSNAWGKGLFSWIDFKKVSKITIEGTGTIDGRGSVWYNGLIASDGEEEFNDPSTETSINNLNNMVTFRMAYYHCPKLITPHELTMSLSINIGRIAQTSAKCPNRSPR